MRRTPLGRWGTPNAFGFSSKGEEVYLFSGDGLGNLTGYYHGFGFGAAEEGLTFGRYVSSEGREHFELEAGPTLGGGNAGPRVGPLVISELMYRPPDVGTNDNTWDEFIEVQNISADAVLLFDPLAPTNTWGLTGGVDYVFPTNLILGAGQYALVVNFDPGNGVLLTNFVAKYGVPAGVLVVGPYGGKLNNLGDTVELKKPYLQLGTAPVWVLMDKIEYSSGAPWPCGTDGTGVSLQRQVTGAFGNDPANWAGALPTAGRANAVVPPGAPVVDSPPVDTVGLKGGAAGFGVGACGPPPYSFQWWFDGNAITNATNATLVINPVGDEDEGPYWVVVTNPMGSVTSAPAILYVARPPLITEQPQSITVALNATALFSVTVTGTPPFQYQWRRNGTNLVGQTAASLILQHAQIADYGRYSVWVGNAYGNALSAEAVLNIDAPLTILEHPRNVTIGPVTNTVTSSNATFSVGAVGRGTLRYQWTFSQAILPEATNATLVVSNVSLDKVGLYAVQLRDDFNTLTSSNATLTLLVKPTIIVPIQAQSVVYGGSASFSVWAVPVHPSLPLTYRWLRSGSYFLTNTQPTLILTNVTASATYQVVVMNAAGSDFRGSVVLTVWPDTDQDGLPDRWMTNYFGHTNGLASDKSRAQDDADGDGATNLEEYQSGTDPTNNLSVFKLVFPPDPLADDRVRFYFTAVSNKTYGIEYKNGLDQAEWSRLADLDSLPTNRMVWITNMPPPAVPDRVYRARIPRSF